MPNHSEREVRDALIDFQLDIERYNRFCSELEGQSLGNGTALVELICLRLLEGKLKWNTRYSIETQIKIFVDDFKVHDAIELLYRDQERYGKLDHKLEKRHRWAEKKFAGCSQENLGYSEQEPHGRNQPYPTWEDFLGEAVDLLLTGKRQWNKNKYPDIKAKIEAIVASLVSHRYDQEKKFHDLFLPMLGME
jgi:hypothetical protein